MSKLVLHLKAPNDINGNPHRLFVVTDKGIIEKVIVENYNGMPEELKDLPRICIAITASEFRRWRKRVKYDNN